MNSLLVTLILNKPEVICLHTVKRFQVLLFNTHNSTIQHYSFVCKLFIAHYSFI